MPVTLPSLQGTVPQNTLLAFQRLTASVNATEAALATTQAQAQATAAALAGLRADLGTLRELVQALQRRVAVLETVP